MNKNIFWIVCIFLISLNVFLFLNYQNPLILITSLIFSILFAFFNGFKKRSKQEKSPYDIGDNLDLFLNRYETELLVLGSLFALIKLIRRKNEKKIINH